MTFLAELESVLSQARDTPPTAPIGGPVVIYGAGNKGREVAAALEGRGHTLLGFMDANRLEGMAGGYPVLRLESWLQRPGFVPADTTAVVAIHNFQAEVAPILRLLREARFARVLSVVDLMNLTVRPMPDHYWLAPRNAVLPLADEILRAGALFTDVESQAWYLGAVRLRLLGEYEAVPPADFEAHYSPDDLPRWKSPLRLIDGGAYTGDTLTALMRRGYAIEAAALFEPDRKNFLELATCAQGVPGSVCFPCGLADDTVLVSFDGAGDMSARLSSAGTTHVQCVAIDQALHDFAPNLIKLDVEGAEPQALRGARRSIERSRPGLAISTYHHPAHLWQLPLLLASWSLGYRLHLRGHGHNSYDLVLYAY